MFSTKIFPFSFRSSPQIFRTPFRFPPKRMLSPISNLCTSPPPMESSGADATPPAKPPVKTVKVVVKGRVQGVFFRDWTVETASSLGLDGWVRNRRDGSVEALFSGEPDRVDEMVGRRCCVGPPAAMVTSISSFPCEEDPGKGFRRSPTV